MSDARCAEPVAFEDLVDYWLEGRSVRHDADLDEHLFACEECSAGLETVAAIAEGVRLLGLDGKLRGGLGPSILERLEKDRRVIRRYRAVAGDPIHCTAGAEDHLVVLELSADLAGLERIDLHYCAGDGTLLERATQLPVVRGRAVVWAEFGDVIRSLPSGLGIIRLLAVEPEGERLVAEYELHHTAYRD